MSGYIWVLSFLSVWSGCQSAQYPGQYPHKTDPYQQLYNRPRQQQPYPAPAVKAYQSPYPAQQQSAAASVSQYQQQLKQQQLQHQQHLAHQKQQQLLQQQKQQQQQHHHYPSPPQAQHHPNQINSYHPPQAAAAQVYQHPPQSSQVCDIPPDLWCDSPQAAIQCNVQRQCEALKNKRQPLKISLVYEALCPYCQKFIANQLGTVFNQFRGQFELELIPWGNARILRDGSFSCNHGRKECDANKLQSCVLDIVKVKGALPFIVCFERSISHSSVESGLQQCSAFIRAQYRQIRQCYDGEHGMRLQRIAAQKTLNTRPHAIMEVPYLLINDYTPTVDNNNLNVMLLPQLLNKWTKMYN